LPLCTQADPVAGRAGLVGTQNIRNNASRIGGLDAICADGTLIEAVDNQPWSGEANVHVSIANWVRTQDEALLPKTRRLWFKSAQRGAKDFDLDCREAAKINSALADGAEVGAAAVLACNTKPQRCFNGQMLGHQGFLLTEEQHAVILSRDARSSEIIHPYLNGVDALTGAALDRYVLDFEQRDALQAAAYPGAYEWVKTHVLPDRERKAEEGKSADGKMRSHHKGFLARWWQLSFGRPEMLSVIKPLPRFLCCAYVTKRPIFIFVSSAVRPSNLIQVFGFADDYSFGILQSSTHWQWFIAKCGKLKSDFRYSAESVFDTFPWPQAPTEKQIDAIAAAGREIRRIRAEALQTLTGGLRALYRTLDLPGKNPLRDAHARLDAAVLAAYGFSAKGDLLQQLLDLNRAVAARVGAGDTVIAPGLPPAYPDPGRQTTLDCLGAA
jgi:hypothetical protein